MAGNEKRLRGMRHPFKTVAVKTIVYRFYSFSILFGLMWILTDNPFYAITGSLTVETLKLAQYYLFEYIWQTY